jgi:hypothetical protein
MEAEGKKSLRDFPLVRESESLAARRMRLETPATPRVPRVRPAACWRRRKKTARGGFFEYLLEAAGIEPAVYPVSMRLLKVRLA